MGSGRRGGLALYMSVMLPLAMRCESAISESVRLMPGVREAPGVPPPGTSTGLEGSAMGMGAAGSAGLLLGGGAGTGRADEVLRGEEETAVGGRVGLAAEMLLGREAMEVEPWAWASEGSGGAAAER